MVSTPLKNTIWSIGMMSFPTEWTNHPVMFQENHQPDDIYIYRYLYKSQPSQPSCSFIPAANHLASAHGKSDGLSSAFGGIEDSTVLLEGAHVVHPESLSGFMDGN